MAKRHPSEPKKPVSKKSTPPELDPFANLFTDYDPDEVAVTMTRLSPDEWQGTNIRGYIRHLSPGHDEQFIRDNYGGGKYMLVKKSSRSGQILDTKQLSIAGNPRLPEEAEEAGIEIHPGVPTVAAPEAVSVDIGGVSVPYTGNLEELQKFIIFIKAIDQLFPKQQDINSVLLEKILGQAQPVNPLALAKEYKDIAETFSGGGGGTTGSTVYDLISETLKQAGPVIANLTRAPGMARRPEPKRVTTGPITGPGPASGLDKTQETTASDGAESPTQTEGGPMGEREIVAAVTTQIVKSWRLSPPKEPQRVVNMIDQLLQQPSHLVRKTLMASYHEFIFDFAETELEADWNDPDSTVGDREKFGVWVQKVFDLYADEKREVKIL